MFFMPGCAPCCVPPTPCQYCTDGFPTVDVTIGGFTDRANCGSCSGVFSQLNGTYTLTETSAGSCVWKHRLVLGPTPPLCAGYELYVSIGRTATEARAEIVLYMDFSQTNAIAAWRATIYTAATPTVLSCAGSFAGVFWFTWILPAGCGYAEVITATAQLDI